MKLYWLARLASRQRVTTFIETGTYNARTVQALRDHFQQVYTIELDPLWAQQARDLFAGCPRVHVCQGDSGRLLPTILAKVTERCLFWLDAHYSGPGTAQGEIDSPIVHELAAIRGHGRNDHIIVIDDARLFNGTNGYPTLRQVETLVKQISPAYIIRIADDMIQACLPDADEKTCS